VGVALRSVCRGLGLALLGSLSQAKSNVPESSLKHSTGAGRNLISWIGRTATFETTPSLYFAFQKARYFSRPVGGAASMMLLRDDA